MAEREEIDSKYRVAYDLMLLIYKAEKNAERVEPEEARYYFLKLYSQCKLAVIDGRSADQIPDLEAPNED